MIRRQYDPHMVTMQTYRMGLQNRSSTQIIVVAQIVPHALKAHLATAIVDAKRVR
ncbi:hypothetical protein L195_g017553 [Trifolium pratense]|uniref:Uncharacterized protein n=1 Tax=Trifolium pratense TaxID=57577 RepID=A0A2K3MU73_TRIPR|nr:hypothetical protein L195_g017553 [Trifolium pratense]